MGGGVCDEDAVDIAGCGALDAGDGVREKRDNARRAQLRFGSGCDLVIVSRATLHQIGSQFGKVLFVVACGEDTPYVPEKSGIKVSNKDSGLTLC